MRVFLSQGVWRRVWVSVLLAVIGCRTEAPYVVPEGPMPPNTVLLSQMMRELSATPGFTDALLAKLDKGEKKGPALMTPELIKRLRELILGKDWQGLDRFPGWTMQAVSPVVGIISKKATKTPETPAGTPSGAPTEKWASAGDEATIAKYLDLGSYSPQKAETVSLDEPSTLPGLSDAELVSEVGAGIVRGDVGNPTLAPMHPESQRLADVLNRLALNSADGSAGGAPQFQASIEGKLASSPEESGLGADGDGAFGGGFGCAVLCQLRAFSLQRAGCDDAVLCELADCDSGNGRGLWRAAIAAGSGEPCGV